MSSNNLLSHPVVVKIIQQRNGAMDALSFAQAEIDMLRAQLEDLQKQPTLTPDAAPATASAQVVPAGVPASEGSN